MDTKSPPMDTSNTTQSSSAAVNGGSAPATVSTATAKVLSHEDIISDGEAWKTKFSGEGESHIARCWWEAVLAHRWASGWSEATTIAHIVTALSGDAALYLGPQIMQLVSLKKRSLLDKGC